MIVVEEKGENAITVASGANFKVTPEDVDAAGNRDNRADGSEQPERGW